MTKKAINLLLMCSLILGCKGEKQDQMTHKYTNDLIDETSPYLLQHAHNPVNWKPWNDATLEQAKESDKLILISIGYAACHWCHVMERESFEDSLVAQVMNDNFINVKVDREERPDVDQIYMNAVQLMTGNGGWPLNVVALPDARPIWGGTYFKKEQWIKSLNQIIEAYETEPQRLIDYASRLEKGIKSLDIIDLNPNQAEFELSDLEQAVNLWSQSFDLEKGGPNRAPKFMMPKVYHFFLRHGFQNSNENLLDYVDLTLTQMAYGGIYDQIGGGFSRYSVDTKWHVPHFEKMLYDNAQLVSLYSDAYLITRNPLYKTIVEETLAFVNRELTGESGTFYSSLDADSLDEHGELEEGAYYVWTKEELQSLLKEDYDLFADYYNINDYGHWEATNYVLIRTKSNPEILTSYNLSWEELNTKLSSWKSLLYNTREKRARPRLDDKVLTSWNALMLKGYIDAYRVLGDPSYLESAIKNAEFIITKQLRPDGGLYHSFKDGKSTINGYLEDYSAVIDAFIALYETTLEEKWLLEARNLTNYAFDHFYDDQNKMFFFTSDEDAKLVSRMIVYIDNEIPSSNSLMAKSLFKLSHYFDNESYNTTAMTMLNNVKPELLQYPSSFSNWLDLMLNYTNNYYEVAVVGEDVFDKLNEINKTYLPNKLIIGSPKANDLPLLKNRFVDGRTLIYVCVNKACKLPVEDVAKALTFIDN